MSAPSYDIVTVQDFLRVPADKIDACLHDFATFLQSAPAWARLLDAVADEMHGAGRVAFSVGDTFRWVDDGAHDMTMTVTGGGEEASLTLTPEDAAAIHANLVALAESEREAGVSVEVGA